MSKDRRRFIQAVGIGAVGALAGCGSNSGSDTDTPGETDAETPTDAPSGDTPTATQTATQSSTATSTPPAATGDGPTIISVTGAGQDIWNTADYGHFFYETLSGDFDVITEVMSVQNTDTYAKAGLMVRPSMEGGAAHVFMRKRPGDLPVSPQWRSTAGSSAGSVTSDAGSDLARNGGTFDGTWQRIERSGDTVRCYGSANGEDWTLLVELGPDQVTLPDEVLVGLAVTSHDRASKCTARFRNLEGIEPQQNGDIGGPLISGSVSVTQNVPVVETGEVSDAGANTATLVGDLTNLGGVDSADVTFEYREVPAQEWTEAGSTTASETGEVSMEVSGLTPRRYYEFRVTADNGEITSQSPPGTFSTPSPGSGSGGDGPRSASQFDPSDGFAPMGEWLTDDTPLIVIDEPSVPKIKTAFNINAPRVVVFETSGTVDLDQSHLAIPYDKCWVAGQTAPSPGVTFVRGGIQVNANDCVVQHIRVRPGDAGLDENWQNDPMRTEDGSENNVIDHVTATWSTDENLSVGYDTNNTTMTNCLIAEPLNESIHPKGPHGYNSLIGNNAKNVTMAGNVWALVTDRNPRLKTGTETATVNNLIHHHADGMWADPNTQHSIVGNAFEDPQTNQANVFGEGTVYAQGNAQIDGASNPMIGPAINQVSSQPLFPEGLSAVSASEVKAHNLTHAGARPADRTAIDERIVSHVRNGEGSVIDSQTEVGGYPALEENTEEVSVPDSGLRAWLREQAVAVEPSE